MTVKCYIPESDNTMFPILATFDMESKDLLTNRKKVFDVGMTICGHPMSSCSLKQILMRGREKQTESQVVLFFIFFWTLITCPWIIIDGSPVNGLKTEIHLSPSYFQLTGDTVPASSSKDLPFFEKLIGSAFYIYAFVLF